MNAARRTTANAKKDARVAEGATMMATSVVSGMEWTVGATSALGTDIIPRDGSIHARTVISEGTGCEEIAEACGDRDAAAGAVVEADTWACRPIKDTEAAVTAGAAVEADTWACRPIKDTETAVTADRWACPKS